MAADLNALRAYLRNVIGFGATNELGLERANAVIAEGLESISDLVDLSHEDGVKTLCSNVRKPAGLISQPNWVAPDPNPQNLEAPMVPRSGQSIPTICEQRLMIAAYGAKIYNSIGRTITTEGLNRDRLREFQKHSEMIENHTEAGSLPELSKSFTVQKFLDQFPTLLREMLGVTKVSLAYVIREEGVVRPVVLPALQAGKPWGRDNEDLMGELIAYTPHSGPAYQADNARVYNLLVNALAGTSALASTTRHQNRRDGRGAYLDLVMHHLSTAKWEKTVSFAEKLLAERKWNGKNARYPLKIHIARHREAFNDLTRAGEQIDYSAPNEASRVRYLLQSIESNDPTICSAKTTIRADNNMRNDFENAADFLIITAPALKSNDNNNNHNVSAINSSNNNNGRNRNGRNTNNKRSRRGKVDTGPKTGVELRYYQRGEWNRLTQAQRDECIEIRRKRKAEGKLNNNSDEPKNKIAALETQIKQMQEHLISVMSSSSVNPTLPPGMPPQSNNNINNSSNSNNSASALRPPPRFSQRE